MPINLKDKTYNFDDIFSKKKNCHIFFIFLLILHYIIPLALFGEITLFYHDHLDGGVVYNYVIGEYYRGDQNAFNKFLGGAIQGIYFKDLLKPYSLLYSILNTELSFWILHFLITLTSYISFFVLSKKISNNLFLCALVSCLFASLNSNALEGFGVAIFPYLIYICIYKSNLKLKHFIILIFFGLNTDLVGSLLAPLLLLSILTLIDINLIKKKFFHILKILIFFYVPTIITSSNLLILRFSDQVFHRDSFAIESPSIYENSFGILMDLLKLPTSFDWSFFYNLPYTFLVIPLLFFSLFSKEKIVKKFLYLIFSLYLLRFIFNLEIFEIINNNINFFKSYRLSWIFLYMPILYSLLALNLLHFSISRYFIIFSLIISIIGFQINSSAVPFIKQFLLKNTKTEYQNIYTFKGYYSKNSYLEIKKIVKNHRVMSVGLDPMVAIMNDIKTIDGYHNLYPNNYKIKFRKIIEKELLKNEIFSKYYDDWGSRVYAFISDPNNMELDFDAAKDIGGKYVVSKYPINNNDKLKEECINCETDLYLYKIK